MRLAITSNGPGEFAGWVRPLLRALYARDPGLEATLFFVPDDYATGREADVARALFPQAHVLGAARVRALRAGRERGGRAAERGSACNTSAAT